MRNDGYILISKGVCNMKNDVLGKIDDVLKNGKTAIGQIEFIDILYGDTLQSKNKIKAYCYDCMGWYIDGKVDCRNTLCPLYPDMPYNSLGQMPTLTRGQNILRNDNYPLKTRKYPKIKTKAKLPSEAQMAAKEARKLKIRKYPEEKTQTEPETVVV